MALTPKEQKEHTNRQKLRRQEAVAYLNSDERLVNAVRIAAKATINQELRLVLEAAADRFEALVSAASAEGEGE